MSSCFLSSGDSENGLVVGSEQAIWLAEAVGTGSDAAVDDVGNWRETSVLVQIQSVRTRPRLGVEDETHTNEVCLVVRV